MAQSKHPKGLIGAALSNMGERFGFYIMMALLALFLRSKFGLDEKTSGLIYSVFYALIYLLALVGGIVADKTKKYKGVIFAGMLTMAAGYAIISIPTPTPVTNLPLYLGITCVGLFIIAFGNGLFKGNLQAVVGQLYDNPEYASKRDSGFQIFYMFINIGALFAPMIAVSIRNWWLQHNGMQYNSSLPGLCHEQLAGNISPEAAERMRELATQVSGREISDLNAFAAEYLNIFSTGFHYAFSAAIVAMGISILIWLFNKKNLPDPAAKKVADKSAPSASQEVTMSAQEIRQRLYALFAVFAVVIFFWFSFHQNGLTLTFFANDFTDLSAIDLNLGFTRIKGAELFQSFNPFFVVFLTPIVIALFSWLDAKGVNLSTPRKIAIGMGIAAAGFAVMTIGSMGLPTAAEAKEMGGLPDAQRVTPWLLIGTYLILTVAELFISPLGLSFVSKVAPPHLQGIMQGAWLGATAVGNQFLFIGGILYSTTSLSITWSVFVTVCLISMFMMLFMVKWLERVAK